MSNERTVSRRTLLGGLGAVGVAGVGAGTTALFSDSEQFGTNSVAAGELDLLVAWRKTVDRRQTTVETSDGYPTPTSDATEPICRVADLKPGDTGYIEFLLRIDGNPGYLSLVGAEQADEERGQPEPERGTFGGSGSGELDELLETTLSYGRLEGGGVVPQQTAYTASLASVIGLGSVGTGIPLDGDGSVSVVDLLLRRGEPAPFAADTTHGFRVDFELPTTVSNGVQTDRFEFAVGFYGEQVRNNL